MFSVGSRITSSAIAVATQPPANSSRCSPSTLLGLLLSRENSTEPDGATLPVRITLKTHTTAVEIQRPGRCLHFVVLMISEYCFAGLRWAYCPAARSLPEARSQIVDAVCPQSHLWDVMEQFIIQQWFSMLQDLDVETKTLPNWFRVQN